MPVKLPYEEIDGVPLPDRYNFVEDGLRERATFPLGYPCGKHMTRALFDIFDERCKEDAAGRCHYYHGSPFTYRADVDFCDGCWLESEYTTKRVNCDHDPALTPKEVASAGVAI